MPKDTTHSEMNKLINWAGVTEQLRFKSHCTPASEPESAEAVAKRYLGGEGCEWEEDKVCTQSQQPVFWVA